MLQHQLSAIVTLAACLLCTVSVHAGEIFIQHTDVTPRVDPRATDDPKLPRVLVVGDSISKGKDVHFYQKEEQQLLGEAVAATVRKALDKPAKNLPLPGETFDIEGRPAFVMLPEKRNVLTPTPWVWYAPTLPKLPGPEERWMFEKPQNPIDTHANIL